MTTIDQSQIRQQPISDGNWYITVTHDRGKVAVVVEDIDGDRGAHVYLAASRTVELYTRLAQAASEAIEYQVAQREKALDILTVGQPDDSPTRQLLGSHIDAGLIRPDEVISRQEAATPEPPW